MDSVSRWLEGQNPGLLVLVATVGVTLMVAYLVGRMVLHPTERRLDRIARALERRGAP